MRKTGWGLIQGAKKYHYFDTEGRSLCGRVLKFTDAGLEDSNDESPDNCAECKRRIKAWREAAE